MSTRSDILARLTRSKNKAADTALALALHHAAPHELDQLVSVIVARNQRPGWTAIIRNFDKLTPSAREKIVAHPRDLFGPMSEAIGDESGNGRQNVINIVRSSADTTLVSLVTDALTDTRPDIRQAAGETLVQAAHHHVNDGAIEDLRDQYPPLRLAIDKGLRNFRNHRQPAVIAAALILERQVESPLWLHFNDNHSEATRVGSNLLRSIEDPALVPAAFIALATPLKVAALTGLATISEGPAATRFVAESFRLMDPIVRRETTGTSHFKLFTETASDTNWIFASPLNWLRLVEHLTLLPQQRLALLRRFLALADDSITANIKLTAIRILVTIDLPDVLPVLLGLLHDHDERVARSSARYLMRRPPSEWRMFAGHMMRSPHVSVKKLVAASTATPGKFDSLWNSFDKLPPAIQTNAARTMALNQSSFNDNLKAHLAGPAAEVATGIKMLLSLPSLRPYKDDIITLCHHSDPKIVSLAVQLIGRLEDPSLKDLLEAAAKHDDPRVRANAVEAMDALHVADQSKQVLGMLTSPYNRERANAIKAISTFDFTTAKDCLQKMLSDPSPLHRLSALWVFSHLGVAELVKTLALTARKDTNARVRRRAEQLIAEMTLPDHHPAVQERSRA